MNGKPSSPVLRGLGVSNGARLLDPYRITEGLPVIRLESGPDLVAKAVSAIVWRDCSAKQAEALTLTAQQRRPD
jgi:hypothetical protein